MPLFFANSQISNAASRGYGSKAGTASSPYPQTSPSASTSLFSRTLVISVVMQRQSGTSSTSQSLGSEGAPGLHRAWRRSGRPRRSPRYSADSKARGLMLIAIPYLQSLEVSMLELVPPKQQTWSSCLLNTCTICYSRAFAFGVLSLLCRAAVFAFLVLRPALSVRYGNSVRAKPRMQFSSMKDEAPRICAWNWNQ